jgi:hypothetical protein
MGRSLPGRLEPRAPTSMLTHQASPAGIGVGSPYLAPIENRTHRDSSWSHPVSPKPRVGPRGRPSKEGSSVPQPTRVNGADVPRHVSTRAPTREGVDLHSGREQPKRLWWDVQEFRSARLTSGRASMFSVTAQKAHTDRVLRSSRSVDRVPGEVLRGGRCARNQQCHLREAGASRASMRSR